MAEDRSEVESTEVESSKHRFEVSGPGSGLGAFPEEIGSNEGGCELGVSAESGLRDELMDESPCTV